MLQNPIRQRMLEANITAGFLRLDPFVPENFFTLGLKLAVERGVFHQIVATSHILMARHKLLSVDACEFCGL